VRSGGPVSMTIGYDPTDFNELTVLAKWRGTVLPRVLCRPIFWVLMSAHLCFYYINNYRTDITLPPLPWKLTTVPTTLLVFFLVFYSANCYTRYYALYNHCMGMSGTVMAFTGLLRVHLPKASPDKLWNLSRLMIASVYLLYFQLSGGASDGGKRVTMSEWEVLLQTGLISQEEQKRADNFRGFRPFLLQIWALRALQDHLAEDKEKGPGANLKSFETLAIQLRSHCAEIVDQMTQPVPFPYYHTLTLMLSLNLLMVSYSLIEFETILTIPCFFIIVLVTIGLKETSIALADPFGSADVDFETENYMAAVLANCKAIISPAADYTPMLLPIMAKKK
jgi:predicted membrane chloride channel (bestrophin family)